MDELTAIDWTLAAIALCGWVALVAVNKNPWRL